MLDNGANFSTSKDNFDKVKNLLDDLGKLDVLVGIPQDDSKRDKESGITNAQLAFIHTHGIRQKPMREEMQPNLDSDMPYSKAFDLYVASHGSPLWHSPPRPIIEPAIENDKDEIASILSEASKCVLNDDLTGASEQLKKAGLEAQGAVQDWFTDPKNGWAPNSEKTIEEKGSSKPLIDTGELRKSITYILRKKDE